MLVSLLGCGVALISHAINQANELSFLTYCIIIFLGFILLYSFIWKIVTNLIEVAKLK